VIIDTSFKRGEPRGLALLVAFAIVACETTTSETRTDPIVTHTKSDADSFERGAVRIVEIEAAGPKSVRVRTTTSFACSRRFIDTKSITVTRTTVVADRVQKDVQNAALAGGGLICAGLLCGGAIAPFVSFDPNQRDNDGRYVPVGEQAGFAWWPVGAAIAGVGVALGAPLAAAMPIASSYEHAESEQNIFEEQRVRRDPACDKEEPLAAIVVSGPDGALGETEHDGSVIVELDSIVDAAARSQSQIMVSVGDDSFSVRDLRVQHRTGAVDLEPAAFPTVAALKAARLAEARAAEAAREREAMESRRRQEIERKNFEKVMNGPWGAYVRTVAAFTCQWAKGLHLARTALENGQLAHAESYSRAAESIGRNRNRYFNEMATRCARENMGLDGKMDANFNGDCMALFDAIGQTAHASCPDEPDLATLIRF
jgi:hypothetical protein